MICNSIMDDDNKRAVYERINDIVSLFCDSSPCLADNSLMYGNMGIVLFLFYYWKWKERNSVYKKASALMLDIFDDLNKRIHCYKLDLAKEDLSFRHGLCGMGWGINHLVKEEMLDCDIQETMCMIDASIYRMMIRQIQNDKETDYRNAFETANYAVSRDDRLSKEYLRRFVNELNELQISFNQLDLVMLLKILWKIDLKHPDIEHTKTLYDMYLSGVNLSSCDLHSLLFLAENTYYHDDAVNQLNRHGECLLNTVDNIKMDSGLENGIISTIHWSNMIYRDLKIDVYKDLANKCLSRLIKDIPVNKTQSGYKFWATSSDGLWCVNYGLLNGLSGIGLVLLSLVNDMELRWGECLM